MIKIFEALLVLGWSAVKFMFGIAHATVLFDLDFFTSVLLTVCGGMLGFYLFVFLDKPIMRVLNWINPFKRAKSDKVKFSRRKRFIIRVKNKYGLAGIALLTPIILMVPVGTFMAMRLKKDLRKVSLYMFISFTVYSLIFCGLFHFMPAGVKGIASGLFLH